MVCPCPLIIVKSNLLPVTFLTDIFTRSLAGFGLIMNCSSVIDGFCVDNGLTREALVFPSTSTVSTNNQ